jgi:holin-like protein
MIGSLVALLGFQLLGEVLVRSLGLPLPGPVVGMLLLFLMLHLRGGLPEALRVTAQGVLQQLSLLFVPAGVGVMAHIGLISSEWLPVLLVIVVSTLATMLVTALTMGGLIGLLSGPAVSEERP